MFSHDSLQTIYQLEWKHKVSLGRYVQPLVWIVRGKLTIPWLVDIGAVVFMIASVVMLVRIFGIKKYWMIVCISGVICTYATFTFTNATFIHESDVFMLALFCSLLSVYLNNKYIPSCRPNSNYKTYLQHLSSASCLLRWRKPALTR